MDPDHQWLQELKGGAFLVLLLCWMLSVARAALQRAMRAFVLALVVPWASAFLAPVRPPLVCSRRPAPPLASTSPSSAADTVMKSAFSIFPGRTIELYETEDS
jgi:hypothetical protein